MAQFSARLAGVNQFDWKSAHLIVWDMTARILATVSIALFATALWAEEGDRPCAANLTSSVAGDQIDGARCAAEEGANEYSSELIELVTANNRDDVRLEAAYALATIDDAEKKEAVISALTQVAGSDRESPVIRYASALTLHVMVETGDDRGAEVTELLSGLSNENDELLQDLSSKLASARSN